MSKQTSLEEKLNAISHGIGVLLGTPALVLLIIYDTNKTYWSLFSVILYGITVITLFMSSTLYHAVKNEKRKHYFRILDHISIYLLIAGTYSPVSLIALNLDLGMTLFFVVWGIAICGIILKVFYTGRFEVFSTLLYLIMGWLIVFDYSNLFSAIGRDGILLLFAGGLAYTIGIIFYAINKIPYNHVIWHLFVLAGAIFHFFMIFFYII
ncbi:hemolysin III family protein [Flavivirga aquatica]|uniref:Hemolysin III family protein n=1 Tax=Flavivirga aquatica TaxID=1849968 RepID=A0A1E5SH73_9FLAO|nr:hemolysin III family protein [Flavivirga aquatica]OEJ98472.1 hemolysin III family protein [Flavivirga aquatica]